MKSATIFCLVSGALAIPFLHKADSVEKRTAAAMSQVQTLVGNAITIITQLQADVTAAVASGKTAEQIVPLVTGAVGSLDGSISTAGVPLNVSLSGGVSATLGATLGSLTGILGGITGGLGLGALLGLDAGVDVGLDIGLSGVGSLFGSLGPLYLSVSALLSVLLNVDGLIGNGAVDAVLGGVLGGLPGVAGTLGPVTSVLNGLKKHN